jgi:hypothetical protein
LQSGARAVAAGVLVAALAACGGDGDRLTSEGLVRRADAICGEYEQALATSRLPQSLDQLARYSRRAHDALAKGLRELRRLHPPAALAEPYRRWLAAGNRAAARMGELERAAKQKDGATIRRLIAEAKADQRTSDRLATRLGLTVCVGG